MNKKDIFVALKAFFPLKFNNKGRLSKIWHFEGFKKGKFKTIQKGTFTEKDTFTEKGPFHLKMGHFISKRSFEGKSRNFTEKGTFSLKGIV